jgi:hypothetical protein
LEAGAVVAADGLSFVADGWQVKLENRKVKMGNQENSALKT